MRNKPLRRYDVGLGITRANEEGYFLMDGYTPGTIDTFNFKSGSTLYAFSMSFNFPVVNISENSSVGIGTGFTIAGGSETYYGGVPIFAQYKWGTDATYSTEATKFGFTLGFGAQVNGFSLDYSEGYYITPSYMAEINFANNNPLFKLRFTGNLGVFEKTTPYVKFSDTFMGYQKNSTPYTIAFLITPRYRKRSS